MTMIPNCNPLPLGRNDVLRLGDTRAWQLASAGGTLWVTIDGDLHDHVLEPGETLRIEPHARALVSALRAPAWLLACH